MKWTIENIPNLKGKVVIITGASSGIGFESWKILAQKGARTILGCRNTDKAQAVSLKIQKEFPHADSEIIHLDLASLDSIHQFASTFNKKYKSLHLLINNAGLADQPYSKTKDGFEMLFGVMHLGHFSLTGLLIELLAKTAQSRVVTISSLAHHFAKTDFNHLVSTRSKKYSSKIAYSNAKMANLLFAYELERKYRKKKINSISVAAHPGFSDTNILRHTWHYPLSQWFTQSSFMGALPGIRAGIDPNVKGGEYYGPDGFMQIAGFPVAVSSHQSSHSKEYADKLWSESEKLTGISYPLL